MGRLNDLLRLSGLYTPVERKDDDNAENAGAAQQQNPVNEGQGDKRAKYKNYSPVPTKEDYNAHKSPRDPDLREQGKPLLGAGAKKKVVADVENAEVEAKEPPKPYAIHLNALTTAQMTKTFDTNLGVFKAQQYERVKLAYQKGADDSEIRNAMRWDKTLADELISKYKTETAQNVAKDAIEEAQVKSIGFGRP